MHCIGRVFEIQVVRYPQQLPLVLFLDKDPTLVDEERIVFGTWEEGEKSTTYALDDKGACLIRTMLRTQF